MLVGVAALQKEAVATRWNHTLPNVLWTGIQSGA